MLVIIQKGQKFMILNVCTLSFMFMFLVYGLIAAAMDIHRINENLIRC